jgi:hypothetical protein
VREVKLDANDYRDIYRLLSHPEHPVDCFTSVRITDRDMILVDDNGLLNNPKKFFIWSGFEQPLAGRGMVVGFDDEGETVATRLTAMAVMANVIFLDAIRVESMETTTEEVELYGRKATRINTRPVFRLKEEGEE